MKIVWQWGILGFGFLLSTLTFGERYNFAQLDEDSMAAMKVILKDLKATKAQRRAYNSLLSEADKALKEKAESVTYKTLFAPSKDKHDYLSISRYWWPNENTQSGLPWVNKDGQTNPSTQSDQVDRQRLGRMIRNAKALALAYYFSGKEAYAKKGVEVIDTWFIANNTYMNPNLEYAQLVPGKSGGRSSGILDGRGIGIHVLDAVKILKRSRYWDKEKEVMLNEWVIEYLDWLKTSSLGNNAGKKLNNHGAWYLAHVASVAWYLDDMDTVKKLGRSAKKLITSQVNEDGTFNNELSRSDSFFYSAFNIEALSRLSLMTEQIGINLWTHKSNNQVSLLDALDYLAIYSTGEKQWPHSSKASRIALMPNAFIRANNALGRMHYDEVLKVDPYKKTRYGAKSSYNGAQEQERYLLNPLKVK